MFDDIHHTQHRSTTSYIYVYNSFFNTFTVNKFLHLLIATDDKYTQSVACLGSRLLTSFSFRRVYKNFRYTLSQKFKFIGNAIKLSYILELFLLHFWYETWSSIEFSCDSVTCSYHKTCFLFYIDLLNTRRIIFFYRFWTREQHFSHKNL